MTSKLVLSGVSKAFGNNQVLNDVSLSIGTGEVISFIGASGSGKTTLLRCMNATRGPGKPQIQSKRV
ncbi:MAG: ATP-binding cassette domain-containing protein [Actinobacteria bacterium]|nr:ATP-binding cassette domain-containing protein [Actinomycetota bacterium]